MSRLRAWLALVLLLCAAAAQAAPFRGVVSYVTDGDSIWVRPADGAAPVEIRLLHIDAPEGCQAYGAKAREALARRLLNEPVLVRSKGTDDYGRTLAQVQHHNEDVGAWMVREGHAWSSGFRKSPGPHARLEAQAREDRKGLWRDARAERPRDFRRRHGRCGAAPSAR